MKISVIVGSHTNAYKWNESNHFSKVANLGKYCKIMLSILYSAKTESTDVSYLQHFQKPMKICKTLKEKSPLGTLN